MTLRFVMLALLVLLWPAAATAGIGQIKTLSGEVYLLRDGERIEAKAGDHVHQADTIVTGSDGHVGITFLDNTRFSAGPDTELELPRFRFNTTTHEGEFVTDIKRGTLAIFSGQMAKESPDQMKVRTPSSVLAVRGTSFLVQVAD